MALAPDPFEVDAAQQAVVVEGKTVDPGLVQPGHIRGERAGVGEAAGLHDRAEAGVRWKCSTLVGDIGRDRLGYCIYAAIDHVDFAQGAVGIEAIADRVAATEERGARAGLQGDIDGLLHQRCRRFDTCVDKNL